MLICKYRRARIVKMKAVPNRWGKKFATAQKRSLGIYAALPFFYGVATNKWTLKKTKKQKTAGYAPTAGEALWTKSRACLFLQPEKTELHVDACPTFIHRCGFISVAACAQPPGQVRARGSQLLHLGRDECPCPFFSLFSSAVTERVK